MTVRYSGGQPPDPPSTRLGSDYCRTPCCPATEIGAQTAGYGNVRGLRLPTPLCASFTWGKGFCPVFEPSTAANPGVQLRPRVAGSVSVLGLAGGSCCRRTAGHRFRGEAPPPRRGASRDPGAMTRLVESRKHPPTARGPRPKGAGRIGRNPGSSAKSARWCEAIL